MHVYIKGICANTLGRYAKHASSSILVCSYLSLSLSLSLCLSQSVPIYLSIYLSISICSFLSISFCSYQSNSYYLCLFSPINQPVLCHSSMIPFAFFISRFQHSLSQYQPFISCYHYYYYLLIETFSLLPTFPPRTINNILDPT